MDIRTRHGFLNLAAAFEGATLLLGLVLGWVSGTFTPQSLRLVTADFIWGAVAVVPMLSILFMASGLRQQVLETLGESLSACKWYDLVALALLAGLSEEILFRGVIEPWIGRWDPWVGLVIANVLFGLAHAVSPMYFLFAMLVGIYFSLLQKGWPIMEGSLGQANLLRPVVAHAVYDFVAFQFIVRDHRRSKAPAPVPEEG